MIFLFESMSATGNQLLLEFRHLYLVLTLSLFRYGFKEGSARVYPRGDGRTPVPNGASGDKFMKVYVSGPIVFKWLARTGLSFI